MAIYQKVLWVFCCERCGHEWIPRGVWRSADPLPTVCPKCKSPYWQRPVGGTMNPIPMPSAAAHAFARMASEALNDRTKAALRWDMNGPSRQITKVELLRERHQVRVFWTGANGEERAVVEPNDLMKMVQGAGSLVTWAMVDGYGGHEIVASIPPMLMALGLK